MAIKRILKFLKQAKICKEYRNEFSQILRNLVVPLLISLVSVSPVIQNAKLTGAVTHIFVNVTTRGYGIFIENMPAEAENK